MTEEQQNEQLRQIYAWALSQGLSLVTLKDRTKAKELYKEQNG